MRIHAYVRSRSTYPTSVTYRRIMTNNLPAPTGPRLRDPASTPLSEAPTVVLAFALGYAAARPQHANTFGPFCAMVEELMTRPSGATDPGPLGGYDQRTVFGSIMATIPPETARQLAMLYQAQRGQRWASTGHREGRAPGGR
ncbi:hypothetical protein PBI_ORION_66 [Mycobacterium phage Orion]|uniref:DUF7423 domain-containing protein n=25 Tax=Pegunavirus TaxID=1623295 RepID=Q716L0_9CAUD|nr:hypothetical protein PBI_PG1_65 [Mycobacterium phage PG1]YP_655162.1 gp66 [Mycobacterium phage Orion]ACI12786.1 hypothetical protein CHAH_66 [Mycobacterium phage Chah]ADA83994.1 hypothetical protein SCOOT17C_65 [Mycobacterium phage Scoot17C]AEJ92761.1 hypothetical protein SEA_SERENDIPITY_64 [Mycobacterium phage Serendipity]AEJ94231.1 hypothetical protein ABU_65 [Mycobacterium phage ABU]AEK07246.1 hypothetical protein OOSTERBAAN_64 [Mycobacterium phage Oosterbaan]AEK09058.1 hypothetical pr